MVKANSGWSTSGTGQLRFQHFRHPIQPFIIRREIHMRARAHPTDYGSD
jgi:hypothetical protein